MGHRAVRVDELLRPGVDESRQGVLRHLAGPQDRDRDLGEVPGDLSRQVHRRGGDGKGTLSQAGPRPHPLGGAERRLGKPGEEESRMAVRPGGLPGQTHLPGDLGLSHDQRIHGSRHPEDVFHRGIVVVDVELVDPSRPGVANLGPFLQTGLGGGFRRLRSRPDLHPVAGGEHRAFPHAPGPQGAQQRIGAFGREETLVPEFRGCGPP